VVVHEVLIIAERLSDENFIAFSDGIG